VVEPGGGQAPQTQELALNVQYRDRFTPLGPFAASGHRTVALASGAVLVPGGDRG